MRRLLRWLLGDQEPGEVAPRHEKMYRVESDVCVMEMPESLLPIWHEHGVPGARITLIEETRK